MATQPEAGLRRSILEHVHGTLGFRLRTQRCVEAALPLAPRSASGSRVDIGGSSETSQQPGSLPVSERGAEPAALCRILWGLDPLRSCAAEPCTAHFRTSHGDRRERANGFSERTDRSATTSLVPVSINVGVAATAGTTSWAAKDPGSRWIGKYRAGLAPLERSAFDEVCPHLHQVLHARSIECVDDRSTVAQFRRNAPRNHAPLLKLLHSETHGWAGDPCGFGDACTRRRSMLPKVSDDERLRPVSHDRGRNVEVWVTRVEGFGGSGSHG